MGTASDPVKKPRTVNRYLDFPSRAGLDSYLASEPYVLEQVWDQIEIETMNVVIGGKD